MNRTLLLVSALFLLGVLGLGCDETESTRPDTSTFNAIIDDYIDAWCAMNQRCDLGMLPTDEALCRRALSGWSGFSPQERGTTVDAAAAAQCTAALSNVACAEVWTAIARPSLYACQNALSGQAQDGEACYSDHDCAPYHACRAFDTCPGVCRAVTIECDDSHFCPVNQRCGPSATCIDKIASGGACSDSSDCEIALQCVAGVCGLGREPGEACGLEARCRSPLRCLDGLCVAPIFGRGEGEPCGVDVYCGNGLWCDLTAAVPVCAVRTAQLGETCEPGSCVPGLVCRVVEEAPQCVAEAMLGESCSAQRPCAAELRCEGGLCERTCVNAWE